MTRSFGGNWSGQRRVTQSDEENFRALGASAAQSVLRKRCRSTASADVRLRRPRPTSRSRTIHPPFCARPKRRREGCFELWSWISRASNRPPRHPERNKGNGTSRHCQFDRQLLPRTQIAASRYTPTPVEYVPGSTWNTFSPPSRPQPAPLCLRAGLLPVGVERLGQPGTCCVLRAWNYFGSAPVSITPPGRRTCLASIPQTRATRMSQCRSEKPTLTRNLARLSATKRRRCGGMLSMEATFRKCGLSLLRA